MFTKQNVFYAYFSFAIGSSICRTSSTDVSNECEGVKFVSRRQWQARNPIREMRMNLPVNHVIIMHTATKYCRTEVLCEREVRAMQDYHLDTKGFFDLAYNFLVGGDGRVYEARGWNIIESAAPNYNFNSHGIAFIGNFSLNIPSKSMLDVALRLIDCGVQKGYITPGRAIHGHRDCRCTDSPGENLYEVIKHWKNFKGGRLPMYFCDKWL